MKSMKTLNTIYFIAASAAIIILQMTVFQLVRIFGVVPNIMLIWLVICAVIFSRQTSFKVALLSGFLSDVLFGKGVGVHIAIYVVVVIFIASLEEKIFKDNYITPVILLVMATAYYHLVFLIVHYFSTGNFVLFPRLFTIVLPEILYNLCVGVALYVLAFRIAEGYQMR